MSDDDDDDHDKDKNGEHNKTSEILDKLTPRERKVLKMRFGIDAKSDFTLDDVEKQFEITRERIRSIEGKALKKIRADVSHEKPRCSFCGGSKVDSKRLIQSDAGTHICEECVNLCVELLDDKDEE